MIINLPTSSALTGFWNFGSLLGKILVIQVVSGIFLAVFYIPSGIAAFDSVQFIMYEVNLGWMFRIFHLNGASWFFVFLYLHIFKALFIGRYRLQRTWVSGVSIYVALIGTAFFGYVLVWGQISFWACTVITNLVRVLPFVGKNIAMWIWGGYAVGSSTVGLFFCLHFIFPFVVCALAGLHLVRLHETGSSRPFIVQLDQLKIDFSPSYVVKDLLNVIVVFCFFIFNFLLPFKLGDVEMFIEANPLIRPSHIAPEWYFLYLYAILRAIPSKDAGVVSLILAICVLFSLSLAPHRVWDVASYFVVVFLLFDCVLLSWLGSCPVEEPFTTLSFMITCAYFLATLCLWILHILCWFLHR